MAEILVTGTSRGIGLQTALALARAGHNVHATMRDPGRSPELADTARKESLPIEISVMDVDSDNSVRDTIGVILKAGPIDVLVNNAGIERTGSTEELDISEFRAVMETNYFGPLRCIQAVLPQMRKRESGCIVNVTSVAGRISSAPMGAYSASKFAMEALSESLAQEVRAHNIRVAVVQPGIIATDMADRLGSDPNDSVYPHEVRMSNLFAASLKNPTPPSVVAQKILDIIGSDSWQFRHPVGPDAEPFLQWRAAMTDEQWVEWAAVDDETWYQAVERDFGLDARRP